MRLTQPPNSYTPRWFAAFLGRVDPTVVAKEILLETVLPRRKFQCVLDVCCGVGRHDWARCLRSGGRLVMDLYHRAYHEQAEGTRRIIREDVNITEVRAVEHGRLHVTLTYAGAGTGEDATESDQFEWQLYSPGELADAAAPAGLKLDRVCTEFDDRLSPTNESPRMQIVFVKAA